MGKVYKVGFISSDRPRLLDFDRVEFWMRSVGMSSLTFPVRVVECDYAQDASDLDFDVLFITSAELDPEYALVFLEALRAKGCRIVLDVNHSAPFSPTELAAFGYADLVICSSRSIAEALVHRSVLTIVIETGYSSLLGISQALGQQEYEEGSGGRLLWVEGGNFTGTGQDLSSKGVAQRIAALNEQVGVDFMGPESGGVDSLANILDVPDSIRMAGQVALGAWVTGLRYRWSAGVVSDWNLDRAPSVYQAMGLEIVNLVEPEADSTTPPADGQFSERDGVGYANDLLALLLDPSSSSMDSCQLPSTVYDSRRARELEAMAFPFPTRRAPAQTTTAAFGGRSELPLVSILIPAYNRPEYLRQALDSALYQSYPNVEVLIGDDSTDNRVEDLIRQEYLGRFSNVKYWHNVENRGQFQNDLDLIQACSGEYVNILMDDDLLRLDKIERQMDAFLSSSCDNLALVTSHRSVVNDDGEYQGLFGTTSSLFTYDTVLSGREAIDLSLRLNRNYFGEPTTVLFRKSYLSEGFGYLHGRRYVCNVDHASWFQVLAKGNALFMNDALSAYRKHNGQQSWTPRAALGGAVDFAHATISSRSAGYVSEDMAYREALDGCIARLQKEIEAVTNGTYDDEVAQLLLEAARYQSDLEEYRANGH